MTWGTIWQSLVVEDLEQLVPTESASQTTTIFRKTFTHNFLWGAQDLVRATHMLDGTLLQGFCKVVILGVRNVQACGS